MWLPEAMAAYRALRSADPDGARRVACAVAELRDDPCPPASTTLGDSGFMRLRLDTYRVLYELVPGSVRVLHVGRVIEC